MAFNFSSIGAFDDRFRSLGRPPAAASNARFDIQGDDAIANLEGFALNELADRRRDPATRFLPGLTRVGADRDEQVANARNEAGEAADVAEGIFGRRTRGMALTDRQKMGARQSFSLNRAVTRAAAGSATSRNIAEQKRQADRGVSDFDDIFFGQQASGLAGLANAEGQRRVRKAQEKAQKKASRNSMIGTVGGLILGALSLSSESTKSKVEESPGLLNKLKQVRIDKWKYHGGDRNHIGPYAEEFNETFGVGKDHNRYLDVVDVLGVTLGSLKELNEKVEAALG